MLDQLNFILVLSFLNDVISDDKINIYSKIIIVDDTIPALMLVLKLFHLYVFNFWLSETLLCVLKPHFISYSYNISLLFHTKKLSKLLMIFSPIDPRFSNNFSEGLITSLLNLEY